MVPSPKAPNKADATPPTATKDRSVHDLIAEQQLREELGLMTRPEDQTMQSIASGTQK